MEDYLQNRPNLKTVVQLVDSRHLPTAQDIQMYEYLRYYHLDGLVVATKVDKLSKNELAKNLSAIRGALQLTDSDKLIAVSSQNRTGLDQLLSTIGGVL